MSADLMDRLRQDAEMLQDGPQSNLTKLWHSEVVKDAAKDCKEAAARIEALEALAAERLENYRKGISVVRDLNMRHKAEVEALEAENARLRAATDRIARVDDSQRKTTQNVNREQRRAQHARREGRERVGRGGRPPP
jgi:hypothetical protein